jgi:molecular chaperone GrpE
MTKNAKHKKEETNPELEELQQQVALLTEALQRERADATNIRRQHDEQIANLRTVIKANVIRDLLPVIDNFERALKHEPSQKLPPEDTADYEKAALETFKKYEDYVNGVRSLVKQFEKTLSGIGVERIQTVGEHFDPKYHEAVSMEEGDGAKEIVSEELQAGYKIGEDVIRHAMVRVRPTE